jgi:hypothetical protein
MPQLPALRLERSEGSLDVLFGPRADARASGESSPAASLKTEDDGGDEHDDGRREYATGGGEHGD